ncbi:hypothetical protein EQ500_01110 [Lactobacillus sp. XV13L]|nr:hypothetical protein [Lactobacillus sp. XV13L]
MLTLLLLFGFLWLFFKLGVGLLKILLFLLACGLGFFFFVHLLVPLLLLGGLICLGCTLLRH